MEGLEDDVMKWGYKSGFYVRRLKSSGRPDLRIFGGDIIYNSMERLFIKKKILWRGFSFLVENSMEWLVADPLPPLC